MRVVAIIPAAGSGSRIGGEIPKQFLKFNGKELIAYTLDVFQRSEMIDEIIIATSGTGFEHIEDIRERYGYTKISSVVQGGKERQDSVFAALNAAKLSFNDLAAVHDAARALLPLEVLNNAIVKAKEVGSALVCVKARDTIGLIEDNGIEYIDRNKVILVQTPQIFKYGELLKAFNMAYEEGFYGTDESSLMRRAGYPVEISDGSSSNFKITTNEDIKLFEKIKGVSLSSEYLEE
ncbi:MAG: 2-C-methyl-D-erythritol 4-phosphate cytidylyltransferase [Ignavibacteriales bacterium]|nr:2-C-methyl-D-erythritol 4-phosphate cytidylyltransferase [Ignavibacteriales bacterium]